MAKFTNDAVLDAALDKVATAVTLTVCSGQPANYAGIEAVALASAELTSGDFSKGDGDVSGRKVTVAARSGIEIDADGTATHVALDDGETLLVVTTCDSQALVSGGTVDVPAFDVEFADVTP